MTLITIITVGLLAALAARPLFRGSTFFGAQGLLSQAMAGSLTGAILAVLTHKAGQQFSFAPLDIWWSTLGATVVVAGDAASALCSTASPRRQL